MPVGGGGKPAGGYRAGKKGSYGCDGYPTVSADGTVHGCHPTKAKAQAQARAIFASIARKSVPVLAKSMVSEGDFVMFSGEEEIQVGRVEYVMTNPGMLGLEGSEYALEYAEDDKPIIVRLYEEEDGAWEETQEVVYQRMSEVVKIESLSVSVDLVMEMGSNDSGIPEPSTETMMAMYDAQIGKAYEGCGCPTCKELNVSCENCPVCQAEAMKSYHSDDEEMDKWDNIEKACWVGYEQQGMKEKDGRMVPNCVPTKKSDDVEKAKKPNYEEMIEPRRGGSSPSNPRLYARIVQEAKDKFDVYPSAVANGWVVQEYKRRGGTYKGEDMDKRDYSMDARRRMAESGEAMPDGAFPIANKGDLMDAIRSVGRASNYAAAKQHIMRRARALDAMDMLPEDWRNSATKGMGEWGGSIFDLNPFIK